MHQIIIVEDRKEIQEFLNIHISNSFAVELIFKENSMDAMALMDILPDVSLVICRDTIEGISASEEIIQYYKENKKDSKVIILGAVPAGGEEVGVGIKDLTNAKEIVEQVGTILGIEGKQDSEKDNSPYASILARHFIYIEESCCDIFIRIKKEEGEDQYIKIAKESGDYPRERIEKFIKQKVKYFYVKRDRLQDIINFISDNLVKNVDRVRKGESIDKKIEVFSQSYSVASKEIVNMGLNSATVQLAESILLGIIESLKDTPNLSGILRKMINAESDVLYRYCHMTFSVSIEILKKMGIQDSNVNKTIGIASFFHDICLVDSPELSKIVSFEELEELNLPDEQYEKVVHHAYNAVEILKNYPNKIPPKAIDFILHHHGSEDGIGFAITKFANFDSLDKVFFISCEFVKELLSFKKEKGEKAVPISYKLRKKYFDPDISRAIDALDEAFKKPIVQIV